MKTPPPSKEAYEESIQAIAQYAKDKGCRVKHLNPDLPSAEGLLCIAPPHHGWRNNRKSPALKNDLAVYSYAWRVKYGSSRWCATVVWEKIKTGAISLVQEAA